MFVPEENIPQPQETLAEANPGQGFVPAEQPQFPPVEAQQPEAFVASEQPQFAPVEPESAPGVVPPGPPQYAPEQPVQAFVPPGQPQYAPAQPTQAFVPPAQPQYVPVQPEQHYPPMAPPSTDSYPFRLLADEEVMGTYPISRVSRPLGKLASYIFLTDSRVIYSAESKTLTSTSYHSREFAISSVQGVDVHLHRGLDSFGAALMVGIFLNLVLTIYGATSLPSSGLSFFLGLLAFFTFVIGVIAFFILRTPWVLLSLVSEQKTMPVSTSDNTVQNRLRIILLIAFALVAPVIVLLWLGGRQLGIFRVEDAFGFANPEYVDRISRELGAHIIDIQSSGKMAEKR